MFLRMWEYEVAEGREPEFELMYGARGAWAQLFARSDQFRGTGLFRGVDDARTYLTVDRFTSARAWSRFLELHAAEYAALDSQGEGLTTSEREIATAGGHG
ncbi:MAG TPA: hypothetical protein VFN24_05590 [Microbacterium sp.]|nr:hypothetical protein [Microbacterium sp.]